MNDHRFELFVPQERRLAESASKHVQVIRRGVRCEVTESNVNSMSRVRNFIRGTSYIEHRVSSVSGQSAGKTIYGPSHRCVDLDAAEGMLLVVRIPCVRQ